MTRHRAAIGRAAIFAAILIVQTSPAPAQTFDSYRCADGTKFLLAFYPSDQRAYLQIDGRAVTLKKRLAISGQRYSGSGVSLTMTASGAFIRHVRRPVTACELS
ncbi:MAG TPA: MliC family protein [Bradyrhizobium sp.]|uniref:MliC family protein n=1 Tax=Bradyrhizobium sp. TaxID=376 RepID=UPI002D7FC6EF|nr:MliC family protein [Bradyrhizobium sp.]HET7889208.1 MliC family protein [Bradyrhizobium sp.]